MNIDGLKIEVLLAKAGITKTELASRCGVSRRTSVPLLGVALARPHTGEVGGWSGCSRVRAGRR